MAKDFTAQETVLHYDTLIVGMGTSGLLAAYELLRRRPETSVLLVDTGMPLDTRLATTDTSASGYGGAGLYLGGRLYLGASTLPVMSTVSAPPELRPVLAGDAYLQRARTVNDLFDALGAHAPMQDAPPERLAQAIAQAADVGVEYVTSYPSRYLSAPERQAMLGQIRSFVEERGGHFAFGAQVTVATRLDEGYLITLEPHHAAPHDEAPFMERVTARSLLLAPGRYGAEWLMRVAGELGARALTLPPAIGVRLELPATTYNALTDVNPDPRLQTTLPGDVVLKTYATCPGGSVASILRYGAVVATGIPVLKRDERGPQTTVAILAQPGVTAAAGAWRGGEQIARRLNERAHGRLIAQRLGDVRRRRETTAEALADNPVRPTCVSATPGALYDAYPDAYWDAFETFLARIDHLAPGVGADETLVYGPAEERFWHVPTDDSLQTEAPGLFVAGDGPGQSQGIIQAGVAGMLAGDGLARYLSKSASRV